MKHRAFASMAAIAVAAGTAALAAVSPAQAAGAPLPPPPVIPPCNTLVDPGGPCRAGAYGIGNLYDNGLENCAADRNRQLAKYRHQGYRTAGCWLQNSYPDTWTMMVLQK